MKIVQFLVQFAAKVSPPAGIPTDKLDNSTLQNVLNFAFALAGAVAVAFIVYGGIKYTLSQGDQNSVKQAKDTILYAIIGIIVVVISSVLVNFVIGKFK